MRRTAIVLGIGMLLSISNQGFGESSVSKFWNKDFPKNLGCGPGNLVSSDDSWLSTSIASSTNAALSPVLPLSTTTGISGCTGGPPIVENTPAYRFFVINLHGIMGDIASGHGENLQAIANLWGVPEKEYSGFAKKANAEFPQIFSQDLKPEDMYRSLFAMTANT